MNAFFVSKKRLYYMQTKNVQNTIFKMDIHNLINVSPMTTPNEKFNEETQKYPFPWGENKDLPVLNSFRNKQIVCLTF